MAQYFVSTILTSRTFRRYKRYYELLNEYPRFKHTAILFNSIRDIIIPIQNWFGSQECLNLPNSDILSREFWSREPNEFHTFDTVTAFNDNDGDDLLSEIDVENESIEEDEYEFDEGEDDGTLNNHIPISRVTLLQHTTWFPFDIQSHQGQICAICNAEYSQGRRIVQLECQHHFHSSCIEEWLTGYASTCPTCVG